MYLAFNLVILGRVCASNISLLITIDWLYYYWYTITHIRSQKCKIHNIITLELTWTNSTGLWVSELGRYKLLPKKLRAWKFYFWFLLFAQKTNISGLGYCSKIILWFVLCPYFAFSKEYESKVQVEISVVKSNHE